MITVTAMTLAMMDHDRPSAVDPKDLDLRLLLRMLKAEKARRDALAEVAALTATLVFFESPRRLAASLADMAAVLGPRPAAVARELTKRFEEVVRGELGELAEDFAARAAPKGEIVVVVGPPAAAAGRWSDAELDSRLAAELEKGSLKDAVAGLAEASGRPKREVYNRALRLAEAAKGPRR